MTDPDSVTSMLEGEDKASSARPTRRAVLATTVTLAGGGIAFFSLAQPARATVSADELIAHGDEITSHDGSIDAIPVDPVIGIDWEGFNDEETDVTLTIAFDTDGETEIVPYEKELTLEGTNGEKSVDPESTDLLEKGWSAATFEADEDGSTATSEVTAYVELSGGDVTAEAEDTFSIVVENHPAQANVGGEISTEIESSEEV